LSDPTEESPRKQLGNRLRLLRVRAGLTGDKMPGFTQSKVSRLETGRTTPSLADIEAWTRATNASAEEVTELASLVEQLATSATSWRILHRLGLAEKQREIAELEQEARHIRTFQPTMIPGLLQVADYARRVIEMAYRPGDIASAIAARIERQSILYDQARRFDFLVTEGALRWLPGDMDMRPQLDRLLSMASLPNVTLTVVPYGPGRMPLLHPFVMWELEDETLITVETYSAELQVRDPADVQRYQEVWTRLMEDAVGGDEWIRTSG
jgi:transcriptional regulator with XRE-family HTH domain